MKLKAKVAAIVGMGILATAGSGALAARGRASKAVPKAQTEAALHTRADRVSYGVGATMARSFKRQGLVIDADALTRGLRDGLSDNKLLMTDEELRESSVALQSDLRGKRAQITKEASDAREREGRAFLAGNARKEGVVTLPSGLQYKVLKTAPGALPTEADTVECHYRGMFIDGSEFDSSERRARPATLRLASVIPGWKEALKLMPVGSKWRLFVPPQLAYGQQGFGAKKGSAPARMIEPNATLVFEVELLAIHPPPRPAGAQEVPDKRQPHAAPAR